MHSAADNRTNLFLFITALLWIIILTQPEVSAVFGLNAHIDGAVRQMLIVDIQRIVHRHGNIFSSFFTSMFVAAIPTIRLPKGVS